MTVVATARVIVNNLKALNEKLKRRVREEEEQQIGENFSASVSICMDIIELFDPSLGSDSKEVASHVGGLISKGV
ncbi:MAG: hypothetical protein KAR06_10825 [Deltaproteobacteria bacterium]|nr:hypothetical protein [Deltaproteobacteria bacterium]